jgi:hypothetical protein
MADISNRTLAIMMVVAILVSLGGLFMSLDRLSKLQVGAPPFITGLVTTGTGYANVSIAETLSIVLSDNNINFGTCTFPGGGATLVLESDWNCHGDAACASMNRTPSSSCVDSDLAPSTINITNDGNVGVNVTFTSSHNSTTLFTASGAAADAIEYFGYRTTNYTVTGSTGACGYGGGGGTASGWNLTVGPALSINYTGEVSNDNSGGNWTEVRDIAIKYRVCANISTLTVVNPPTVLFYAKMNVSPAEPVGKKKATLTFTGSTVSKG